MSSTKNHIAIIVGNGKSREEVDLNTLVGQGTIYGCNALYRDFDGYDYLVAIDDGIIDEIKTTSKRITGQAIFPPEERRWEDGEYDPTHQRRNNAGMVAMLYAIEQGAETLYCIGFDFILAGQDSVSNVYDGTDNYGPETRANISDNYNRIKYLEWFARVNPNTQFVFVIPDNSQVAPIEADNIVGMRMGTFLKKTK